MKGDYSVNNIPISEGGLYFFRFQTIILLSTADKLIYGYHGYRSTFDNAHAPPGKGRRKYKGRIVEYDHAHYRKDDPGTPYSFESAEQLLEDFFNEVTKRIQSAVLD